jgi:hypothetical protein
MMTQLRWILIVVLGLLGAAAPATAAEPPGEPEPAAASVEVSSTAKEVRYKAKTEIDFGERKVNGGISGPMGVYADSLADQQWNPLIRLRRNFDREILASVDGVR